METKKYRFDEVTINFDKKRIPLSSAQQMCIRDRSKAIAYILNPEKTDEKLLVSSYGCASGRRY